MATLDLDNETQFIRACEDGSVDKVTALMKAGVDPGTRGSIGICNAVEGNHLHVLYLLLDDGRCDPTAMDNCALYAALRGGFVDGVVLLLNDHRVRHALVRKKMTGIVAPLAIAYRKFMDGGDVIDALKDHPGKII